MARGTGRGPPNSHFLPSLGFIEQGMSGTRWHNQAGFHADPLLLTPRGDATIIQCLVLSWGCKLPGMWVAGPVLTSHPAGSRWASHFPAEILSLDLCPPCLGEA